MERFEIAKSETVRQERGFLYGVIIGFSICSAVAIAVYVVSLFADVRVVQ